MQLSVLSLILLAVSLGSVSPSGLSEVRLERGGCPVFWFSFNGRCYKYVSNEMSRADAEIYCVSQKAHLVSIHSEDENNFVKSLIYTIDHSRRPTWIGLSDAQKDGLWMWSDGSRVDFTRWDLDEPNNAREPEQCVLINWEDEKQWNDWHCAAYRPFVCKSCSTTSLRK